MKILFLIYHGFSEVSGISKKVHYQAKGLRENGHEVHLCYYDVLPNGHRCRFIDEQLLCDYGTGQWAALRQRLSYGPLYDYCLLNRIEFVYARSFQNANPWLIHFFKRLHKAGIKCVTEIPTYPYDQEFVGFPFWARLGLRVDQLFRRGLARQMEAMVTFSDADTIFGQRTIRISNGVDFDSIPLHRPQPQNDGTIHLLGVAEVHYWHGFDRLIAGLGEYYLHGGKRNVVFHIVGGVHPNDMRGTQHAPGMQVLIDRYRLHERVVFHGTLFGEQLDAVFNQCCFAIGSLARHRSGLKVIKTLKNREYATRGLPFIYSEQDSDFDHQPYVLKAPANETPIDVERMLQFIDSCQIPPADIRQTVEPLTWQKQMRRVLDAVYPPQPQTIRLVYLTPSLYMAGGVERVLSLKANYLAEHFGYDITIVLTDGKDKPLFYDLSPRVKVIHLDINFELLWHCSFWKKIPVYLRKQRQYEQKLKALFLQLRPDVTISLLRREINFLCSLNDGSRKVGELHVNRQNYRNFEANDTNFVKRLFSLFWMHGLVRQLRRLDRFVVLTHEDREAWSEIEGIEVIPDPLSFPDGELSTLERKRVIAVGRYTYQKGFDLLLRAWAEVERQQNDWHLDIFGTGERTPYERLIDQLGLDRKRVHLHGATSQIRQEYVDSSIFVLSSRFEGFGMVLVEAMSCGLPVVSFDCPCGPKDIIDDGHDGLLVPNGDVNALSAALLRVIRSPRLAREMGAQAVKKSHQYQLPILAERWKQLFEGLMK